jgi:hypothetical protein
VKIVAIINAAIESTPLLIQSKSSRKPVPKKGFLYFIKDRCIVVVIAVNINTIAYHKKTVIYFFIIKHIILNRWVEEKSAFNIVEGAV